MTPPGWCEATLTDISAAMFDGPFGSALKTSDYTADGIRVARLENIGHLEFRAALTSYISVEKYGSLTRHTLRHNDILFSSFVDKETRVCLVPENLDGRMINKADCFCIRPELRCCEPAFLAYRLAAPAAYETFGDSVRGVTRPRVGLRDLARLSIELPPLAEQRRITAKLDTLTARTGQARKELSKVVSLGGSAQAQLTLLDRLDKAILAKAFRGELVPQDPVDEPASALLQRIKAERAVAPAGRRGRKPR